MGECPLCGESTNTSSTRLIKDTCGHTKCRMCLLQEENGCRICENESYNYSSKRIDSIGNFNYPLPITNTPNYEDLNCEPCHLTINEIPNDIEYIDYSPERNLVIDEDYVENVQQKQDNEKESIEYDENVNNHNNTDGKKIDKDYVHGNQKELLESIDNQNIENENKKSSNKIQQTGNNKDQNKDPTFGTSDNCSQSYHNSIELIKTFVINKTPGKIQNLNSSHTENTLISDENENISEDLEQSNKERIDCNEEHLQEHINNEKLDGSAHSFCQVYQESLRQNKNVIKATGKISNQQNSNNQLNNTSIAKQSSIYSDSNDGTAVETDHAINKINSIVRTTEECHRETLLCTQPNTRTLLLVINQFPNSSQNFQSYPLVQQILVNNNNKNTTKCTENNKNDQTNSLQQHKSPVGYKSPISPNNQSNSLQPYSSPVQYLGYRSPDYRLSDYLIFKKQNNEAEDNKKDASPAQSIPYMSPEFRLNDYLIFNKNSLTQEQIEEEEENLHNEKENCNKSPCTSFEPSSNKNSPKINEIVERNQETGNEIISSDESCSDHFDSVTNKTLIEEETDKTIVKSKSETDNCNKISTKLVKASINKSLDNLENFDSSIFGRTLEKDLVNTKSLQKQEDCSHLKRKSDEIINRLSDNFKNINCPLVKKKIKAHEEIANKIEEKQLKRPKKENDENKENKVEFSKKKKIDKHNDGFIDLNIQTCQNTKDESKKSLKSSSHSTKRKDSKKKDTKTALYPRRGQRKKKRKVRIYEDEDSEPPVKKKRGRPCKDWSHIIELPVSPTIYKCTFCAKTFKVQRSRIHHSACRTGKVAFQCEQCDRSFAVRTHYVYHMRIHTGDKPFKCNICDKSFVQKHKLNRHKEIHKRVCDLECDECGKTFKTKQYLKNHLLIHQDHEYKCKYCPKTFTLDNNRKRHELSHLADRPFKCDVCSTSFKCKFLLTRHKRIHGKSRPFSCDICNRVFLSKFEVQRHITSHSETKPYRCKMCGVGFRRKDNLTRHVKHHHTNDGTAAPMTATEVVEKRGKGREQKGKGHPDKKSKKRAETPNPKSKPSKAKKTPSCNSSSSTKCSVKPAQNTQPCSFSIQRLDEPSGGLTAPIPRQEVLDLNRQIEAKISQQSAICSFPGLMRVGSVTGNKRRESSDNNSNSNDGTNCLSKSNSERSKNGQSSKKEQRDAQNSENVKVVKLRKDINVHWRRRTAESLKPKLTKN